MVYQVPPSNASKDQNKFKFEVDGVEHVIPKLKFLPVGTAEKLADPEVSESVKMLLPFPEGAVRDAVRTLDSEQFQGLVQAYRDDSGISVGESSAS
jgi:hypothetical protein